MENVDVIHPAELQNTHIDKSAMQNAMFLNEILHAFSIGDGGTSVGGLVGKRSAIGKTSDKNWVFSNKQIKMFDIDPLLVEHEYENERKEKEEEKQEEVQHKKAYTFKEKFENLSGKKFSIELTQKIDATVTKVQDEVLERYQQFSNVYCKENYCNMVNFREYIQDSLGTFNKNIKKDSGNWSGTIEHEEEKSKTTACCQIF